MGLVGVGVDGGGVPEAVLRRELLTAWLLLKVEWNRDTGNGRGMK